MTERADTPQRMPCPFCGRPVLRTEDHEGEAVYTPIGAEAAAESAAAEPTRWHHCDEECVGERAAQPPRGSDPIADRMLLNSRLTMALDVERLADQEQ